MSEVTKWVGQIWGYCTNRDIYLQTIIYWDVYNIDMDIDIEIVDIEIGGCRWHGSWWLADKK